MRKLTRSILATTAVIGVMAIPAAAVSADNDVSFTVEANSEGLSISAAPDAVTLESGGNPLALTAATVSGTLPQTTVTDERGQILAGWAVSVSATDWESDVDADGDGTTDHTVGAEQGRAYLDAADLSGLTDTVLGALSGMTVTGAELNVGTSNLSSAYTLIEGTTTLGNGSVQYTPTVDVDVPANTPAGTYTATVTQTVS